MRKYLYRPSKAAYKHIQRGHFNFIQVFSGVIAVLLLPVVKAVNDKGSPDSYSIALLFHRFPTQYMACHNPFFFSCNIN